MTTTNDEPKLDAETAKNLAEIVDGLTAETTRLERYANPDVLAIVLDDAEARFRASVPEAVRGLLRPDAVAEARQREAAALDAETAKLVAQIDTLLPAAEKSVAADIDRARRLPGFADGMPANAPNWHNAALLDILASDAAERWISRRTVDEVTKRYEQADERGRDRAFVRLVEQMADEGQTVGMAEGPAERVSGMLAAQRSTIEARREARVPKALREAEQQIKALSIRVTQARARLAPTSKNIGRAARTAGLRAV